MKDTIYPREVIIYWVDGSYREPFTEWLNNLRDSKGRRCILRRIHQLKQGNRGDHKLMGEGIIELRIFFGPGYRVYIGEYENKTIILLGGDKDRQPNDVQRAKDYWRDYKDRRKLQ